jgi:hypothetical protein
MLTRHDVRIDVSAAVGIAGAEIAATIIAPRIVVEEQVVAVGFPAADTPAAIGTFSGLVATARPSITLDADGHSSRSII